MDNTNAFGSQSPAQEPRRRHHSHHHHRRRRRYANDDGYQSQTGQIEELSRTAKHAHGSVRVKSRKTHPSEETSRSKISLTHGAPDLKSTDSESSEANDVMESNFPGGGKRQNSSTKRSVSTKHRSLNMAPRKSFGNRHSVPMHHSTHRETKSTPAGSQLDSLKQDSNKDKTMKRSQSVSEGKRGPTLLQAFFGSPNLTPEKKVTCLTCLSDDIPISKSAKLACSHRMCHKCLKRIFTMSVADPQHMPPRCCTSNHIPLKHVDKLFDTKFKTKWNKKYQEYTTKNRIYCPSRGCGEWIKPANIHIECGRKYGKCSRCRTKVCCMCNGKWHRGKECPKDEDTNKFIEVAQQEGWQRCFNCSAMVELKEGCNHMTCRCTAEFCIICGAKWKTCECPWFNYGAVEADQLNHMNVPQEVQIPADGNDDAEFRHPIRYQEEVDRRREQEELDEMVARRMQRLLNLEEEEEEEEDEVHNNNDEHHPSINNENTLEGGNAYPNLIDENFTPITFQDHGHTDREGSTPPPYLGQRRQRNRYMSSSFGDPRPAPGPIYNPIIDSDGPDNNHWNSGVVSGDFAFRRQNTESARRRRRLKTGNTILTADGEDTQLSRVEQWRNGVATAER